MADINQIKTKIALKQNSYEYWDTSNSVTQTNKTHGDYIPLYGEVCFCEIPPLDENKPDNGAKTVTNPPTVLFKVGDGETPFKFLNWASGLAADVHGWAKKSLEEFIAWVAKTPKAVTLTINSEEKTYTIEEAIKLVRSEIAAGGTAAALTIADESTTGKIKYVTKQGDADVVEAIEVNAGTGVNIAVQDDVPVISHQVAPTTGNKATATAETEEKSTFVTEVTIDALGHVAGVKTAEIDIPDSPSITITDKTDTDTDDIVYAVTNLEEKGTLGHEITPTYKAVPTQKYVNEKIAAAVAGAVDYLGVVNNTDELSAVAEVATHGDFVRIATAFGNYHIGDMLIYNKPEEDSVAVWDVIHGEEGDIIEVEAGNGLTGGGSTGKVILSIAEKGVTEGMLEQGVQEALDLARAAATDASNKAVVVLGEAQKYADEKVAALAGDGNTTTVKAVADRVKGLEDANHISDVEADIGLKVIAGTNGANNKVAIDETVVFVLDCNW